jgi:hypothetical protein
MGLFTGMLAVACNDDYDRVSSDGSSGQAAAGTAGAPNQVVFDAF